MMVTVHDILKNYKLKQICKPELRCNFMHRDAMHQQLLFSILKAQDLQLEFTDESFWTHKSLTRHLLKVKYAGCMVAQVLDLRRTHARVQAAMTQHFSRGARLCRPHCHCLWSPPP